jgi:acetoin utilization protein AcuC
MPHELKHSFIRPETKPLPTAPEQATPISLHQLRGKSKEFLHLLSYLLLPIDLLVQFGTDPITLRNEAGEVMVEAASSEDGTIWGLLLKNDIDRRDPLIEIEMIDTPFGRISVTWVGMNDPRAPRFDIDRLPNGDLTLRGKASRNLTAEAAALVAGLAPGQVRRGLGSFSRLLNDLEQFFACLHFYEFEVEPLYYHNAILFERHGFQYVQGHRFMQRIHEGFSPGGIYRQRLDNSTLFRDSTLAGSIRGRSWAIHDGILDESWDRIKLIKRIGVHAGVSTAFGVGW